jgi:hypothetical protein
MRCASLFVILGTLCCSVGFAQDFVTITSDPRDMSRPISTLLDQLRQRDKIQVTYEDPRYSNSGDIQDVTSKVAKSLSPAEEKFGPRILVPNGKAISFVYAPDDLRTPEGVQATIARMLREYEALGGAGFAVTRDGVRFHVVPGEVLNVSGERTSQATILDTVISIPPAERDDAQLLHEICDQIQKQTGYRIDIGPGALNMHDRRRTQGLDSQPARTAFERVWDRASAPGSFVWDLYYDPSDKSYGLSFSHVGSSGPVVK